MKKYYAIDWMLEDFYFNNEEKINALKNEIEDTNKINNINIQLCEIESLSNPGGATSIIIRASKNEMIKIGYDVRDIDDFEVFI